MVCVHFDVYRGRALTHTVDMPHPQEMKTTPNPAIFRMGVNKEGVFKLDSEENKVREGEEGSRGEGKRGERSGEGMRRGRGVERG